MERQWERGRCARILLVVIMVLATMWLIGGSVYAAGPVKIDTDNFPDAKFRDRLMKLYPSGVITQEQLESRKSLSVSGYGVKKLDGVELFTNLKSLNCSNNSLTELDWNTAEKLKKLTTLNISGNTKLKKLEISGLIYDGNMGESGDGFLENRVLTTLNASGCAALQELDCPDNALTSLDVTGCTALTKLACAGNKISALDVSTCKALQELDCPDNTLTSLDVSSHAALKEMNCSANQLTTLKFTSCPALQELNCSDNALTSLTMKKKSTPKTLDCSKNALTAISFVSNKISVLNCSDNQLTELKLPDGSDIASLHCEGNRLGTLDLSNVTFTGTGSVPGMANCYGYIDCSDNQLTSLKLPAKAKLSVLICNDNQLTSLDLSQIIIKRKNKYYSQLNCSNNQLTSLKLPETGRIMWLDCDGNKLKSLKIPTECTVMNISVDTGLKVKPAVLKIGKLPNKTYTGKKRKQASSAVKVTFFGNELNYKEDLDEKSYKNNRKIGTATLIVQKGGIIAERNFKILPAKAKIKKAKAGKRKLTVRIARQIGGVKYQISLREKGGKAKAAKMYNTGKRIKTIKKLKSKKNYIVKVRAFKKVKGKMYYGKWSEAKTITVK